ncbi:hypothetical protein Scep_021419 [Stephania cephalantha]|uniref:Reverse transcriptase domain-containing protein n=1 Tax=Stephania cephalantha TaxID=152367 RepID=A0AAP0F3D7_9MAGN
MVDDAFNLKIILSATNRSLITLLPKQDNPEDFIQFRPISLCMVNYKLIMKVVANRLKPMVPTLVNQAQTSFVAGRHISNDIIIVQELLYSMRSVRGAKGLMAIKINLEKTYDRLSWNFIRDSFADVNIFNYLSGVI